MSGAPPDAAAPDEATPALKNTLSGRHVTMIALGGIIGAGLFVGSGPAINTAGPGVILSYLLSGILIILVIRGVGEMAVARPAIGSIAEYPRLALGQWAGFTVGWVYWYFWVVIAAVEAVGGAGILARHIPSVPSWAISLVLMLVMTAINLFSVKMFGEAEFWFASIKVVAIVVFLGICGLYLLGLWETSPGLSGLTDHGGFFPHGGLAVIVAAVSIMFSMGGAEIATIAAAESKDPGRLAGRATRQVMTRVMVFYVASITAIVLVIPWNATNFTGEGVQSPFTVALAHMGIPFVSVVMEIVIVTAVLSSLNSCLYITSRTLFGLGRFHDAPQGLTRLNRRRVPSRAILAGTAGGYIAVIFNYFFPDQIFAFLLTSSGALMLMYYILLMAAQIRLRRRLQRTDPGSLQLKMWGFPYVSYLAVGWMVAVLGIMLWLPSTRLQVILGAVSIGVVLLAYLPRKRFGRAAPPVRTRPDFVPGGSELAAHDGAGEPGQPAVR